MTTEGGDVEVFVTDEVKANIGKEGLPATWLEPLDRNALWKYVLGSEDSNPLYSDEEYASRSNYGGLTAPPFFLAAYPVAFGHKMEEWQEQHPGEVKPGGTPRVTIEGLPRGVNGGSEIEWFRPYRIGDTLTWKSRIADVVQRIGRNGPIVVTTNETEFRNQHGELVAIMTQSGIRMK
jgi:acyl dehydratase